MSQDDGKFNKILDAIIASSFLINGRIHNLVLKITQYKIITHSI